MYDDVTMLRSAACLWLAWWEQSGSAVHVLQVAANNLAVFFEKGKHATKDLAAKYYTIACEASYPIALANYGTTLRKNV